MTNQQWLAEIAACHERSCFVQEEAGARFAIDDARAAAMMAWLCPADAMAAALCLRAAELYLAINWPERAERFARMGLQCEAPGSIVGRLHHALLGAARKRKGRRVNG